MSSYTQTITKERSRNPISKLKLILKVKDGISVAQNSDPDETEVQIKNKLCLNNLEQLELFEYVASTNNDNLMTSDKSGKDPDEKGAKIKNKLYQQLEFVEPVASTFNENLMTSDKLDKEIRHYKETKLECSKFNNENGLDKLLNGELGTKEDSMNQVEFKTYDFDKPLNALDNLHVTCLLASPMLTASHDKSKKLGLSNFKDSSSVIMQVLENQLNFNMNEVGKLLLLNELETKQDLENLEESNIKEFYKFMNDFVPLQTIPANFSMAVLFTFYFKKTDYENGRQYKLSSRTIQTVRMANLKLDQKGIRITSYLLSTETRQVLNFDGNYNRNLNNIILKGVHVEEFFCNDQVPVQSNEQELQTNSKVNTYNKNRPVLENNTYEFRNYRRSVSILFGQENDKTTTKKSGGSYTLSSLKAYHNRSVDGILYKRIKTSRSNYSRKMDSSSGIIVKPVQLNVSSYILTPADLEACFAVIKQPHYLWISGHPLVPAMRRILTTDNWHKNIKPLV